MFKNPNIKGILDKAGPVPKDKTAIVQWAIGIIVTIVLASVTTGTIVAATTTKTTFILGAYPVYMNNALYINVYDDRLGADVYVGQVTLVGAAFTIKAGAANSQLLNDPTEESVYFIDTAITGGESGFVTNARLEILNATVDYFTIGTRYEFGDWHIHSVQWIKFDIFVNLGGSHRMDQTVYGTIQMLNVKFHITSSTPISGTWEASVSYGFGIEVAEVWEITAPDTTTYSTLYNYYFASLLP